MKSTKKFLTSVKKMKQSLQRKHKIVFETDPELRETLAAKIEMLNMMIVEFGGLYHPNSIKNLKHRARF